MTEEQRLQRFHGRWSMPLAGVLTSEKFVQVRTRFEHVFHNLNNLPQWGQKSLANEFLFRCGDSRQALGYEVESSVGAIVRVLRESQSFEELLAKTQHLFWALTDIRCNVTHIFAQDLQRALALSPEANARIVPYDGSYEFYPKGAALLDDQVVDTVLGGLSTYAQSAEAFNKALMAFQAGGPGKHREVADGLRFSLESLLRRVLNNDRPLEGQKTAVSTWLQTKGLHQQLVNMNAAILGSVALYNNDCVKHPGNDHAPGAAEIEFLIYQTATFMRLVLELQKRTA